MRVSVLAAQSVDVLLDLSATVEDRGADVGHVLGEAVVFVLDLKGELTGVAHHKDGSLAVGRLELLKGG